MRKTILAVSSVIIILLSNCNAQGTGKDPVSGNAIHITTEMFKQKVFNYDINKEWKYLGDKPCIVDFYADWCPPCRKLSPVIEEIAKEYAGKIVIYKVDADKEKELLMSLGISSLPTLLFCPQTGKPQASMGALPKEDLKKAINEILIK